MIGIMKNAWKSKDNTTLPIQQYRYEYNITVLNFEWKLEYIRIQTPKGSSDT